MECTPWAARFVNAGFARIFGPVFYHQQPDPSMNATVKSYLYFLAFMAVTKMVVKPVATQMNIPVLKDML